MSAVLPTRAAVALAHGAVLKSIREGTTGLTQEDLAEKAAIDSTHVSLMELGERCPSLWVFIKVAIALDVDPLLLLSMTLGRLRGQL